MLKRIENYVSKWGMLKKEDKIIVGVSGGADSVCLLFVLLELQKKIPFELHVVHINHGLRGAEADEDEEYVRRVCEEKEIPLEIYKEDVGVIARERRQSLEEAGREVRRELFMHTMKKHSATKIALAHHMNDSAETFFMNVARGSGLKGLGGIRPVVGCYIRPLLCLERREIESFLEERNISYCVDATNESDCYTRNRVRNKVIPLMEEEINSRTVVHINETMNQLQAVQEYMETQAKKYFRKCVKQQENGYIVLEESFKFAPEVLRPLVVKDIFVKISKREKDIGEIHLKNTMELMEKQVGRQIDLPYGMQARRVYEGILIGGAKSEVEKCPNFFLDFSKGEKQEFRWKEKRIVCRLLSKVPSKEEQVEKNNTKWFDYDIITEDVCVRTRQPGDYITIHSDGRTQKVKSFFINEKIPQEQRDDILLVAEGSHILWIEGNRTNARYHINEHTKRVLEIEIYKGESYGRED